MLVSLEKGTLNDKGGDVMPCDVCKAPGPSYGRYLAELLCVECWDMLWRASHHALR